MAVDPHLVDGSGAWLTLLGDVGSKSQLVEDDNPNETPPVTAFAFVAAVAVLAPIAALLQPVQIQQAPPPGNPPPVVTAPGPSLRTVVLEPSKVSSRPAQFRTGRPLLAGPAIVIRSAPPLSSVTGGLPALQPVRILTGNPDAAVVVTATYTPARVVVDAIPAKPSQSVTIRTAPARFLSAPPRNVVVEPVRSVVQVVRSFAGITVGAAPLRAPGRGRVFTSVSRVGRIVVVQSRSGRGFTSRSSQGRTQSFGGT